MKKIFLLMMTLILALSLVACGGDKKPAASDTADTADTEFDSMTFGYITMSVPSGFNAAEEKEGLYVSAGPAASIVVTPTLEIDLQPSEWDESLAEEALEMMYGSTYTDLKLAAFEGDVNMNGNTAVYYAFIGKNADGKERLVQVVRLFNADLTAQYIVTLIHDAEDEFFTPEVGGKIMNSITLAPDAQNLTAEFEG